ncbi:UTP--glucose-1-phosphate uridylyltransferase [Sanguibacter antarcticus]|uniref:UTP--glucose-1-phosphate uridylyltransferase n=1 Tax=Sanguibacter antarcticus TaxID=372484 RepID=A0A2A9E3M4_9MICO|nr:UTP--glucose-1-phosphate uridylyltransferase [Sanguibacter antarcticus]PFG33246.1 UTP--glucose-1-phosphate uridylyltransferase [Sanguibacter antarcticus]
MTAPGLSQAQQKMRDGGVHPTAIDVFSHFYGLLESGETGVIRECDVDPLVDVDRQEDLEIPEEVGRDALALTAIIKLNGGLGTSMGMDKAKSLLTVRGEESFLDIIVGQVRHARETSGARLPLIFMNSFRTQDDTLAALAKHPDVAVEGVPLDFLQNREPKLRADDLSPVTWEADPTLEWCPPGHGDLYTALQTSGVLKDLVAQGFRYVHVSNSDNLGASPDAAVAGWFASSGAPFGAEVAVRTPADRKGGHQVVRKSDGRIVLRETAQTLDEDAAAAADISKHKFFNTNNLWFDLEALTTELDRTNGVLQLPLIKNSKTVDPADASSTPVIQIESAMGAAIEVFEGAVVLEVDRSRFLPVKTTNDLLVLRSDVYELGEDYLLRAVVEAPLVDLDSRFYKTIGTFDARFSAGAPSLVATSSLSVAGDWTFEAGVTAVGDAVLSDTGAPSTVPSGATISADGLSEA